MSTALSEPMAKKRSAEGQSGKEPGKVAKTTTKVRAELIRRAKTVASFRDQDLFDYLDQILSASIDRDYGRIVKADQEGGAK
jgi:hypothetical protein